MLCINLRLDRYVPIYKFKIIVVNNKLIYPLIICLVIRNTIINLQYIINKRKNYQIINFPHKIDNISHSLQNDKKYLCHNSHNNNNNLINQFQNNNYLSKLFLLLDQYLSFLNPLIHLIILIQKIIV